MTSPEESKKLIDRILRKSGRPRQMAIRRQAWRVHPIVQRWHHGERGTRMHNEMTRAELIEQLAALERRLNERFDLIERMLALGFDDTSDQINLRFGELDVLRDRQVAVTSRPSADTVHS